MNRPLIRRFSPALVGLACVATVAVMCGAPTVHAQIVQLPSGTIKTAPEGQLTKAQILAAKVTYFSSAATPKTGGGHTMTGVCDGDHKFYVQGRKDGTTGPNIQGQPAVMFSFEMICNKPDPTNPPIYTAVSGKPNTFTYDTNVLLSATPGQNPMGSVTPGAWTVNASQMGGTSAPTQKVTLPPYAMTF